MTFDMPDIISKPSPNFGPRRNKATPDMVVLHYTAMATCEEACERLCAPEHEVSAHYLISENGVVFQLVDEALRAWHAGSGAWGDVTDINSRSIGIELANTGQTPFSEPQMAALEAVLSGVMQRWDIPPERVIGHSDMAPLRKADPGHAFDWQRLALGGLSVWPNVQGEAASDDSQTEFLKAATIFGYPADAPLAAVLAAFRQRFRPKATGALVAADMVRIQALARDFPA